MNSKEVLDNMRDEEKLLLICSCVNMRQKDLRLLQDISCKELDWEYIVKTACYHKVLPLLYQNIKKNLPHSAPDHVLDRLKSKVVHNGARNLFVVSRLFSMLKLLHDHGVQSLVFKGPVLAENIFGNIGFRVFSDLDLLISRKDIRKTVQILKEKGFQQDIDLSLAQYEKLVKKGHHAVLMKESVAFELHWELTGRYFSKEVELESLWSRSEDVDIAGQRVKTLGQEDLLLYLCIHGCRHYWFQLDSVCCVAELVKTRTTLDWDLVYRLAQELGAVKMLLLGLLLARELLGVTLSAQITKVLILYPHMEHVTANIAGKIFSSTDVSELKMSYREYITYHHHIIDNRLDWLRFCMRPLLNPTHSDWMWIRLPALLSPLYYILRPLRLIGKYSNKLFK